MLSNLILFNVNAITLCPDENKVKPNIDATHILSINSQNWEFYSSTKEYSAVELENESDYRFGNIAGCLYSDFMEIYVVREEVVPGDPTKRTVIRKPSIYNAVKTMEKYFSKAMKNKTLTQNEVSLKMEQILKIAIAAFDSESKDFEDALYDNRKSADQLSLIFERVRLKEI